MHSFLYLPSSKLPHHIPIEQSYETNHQIISEEIEKHQGYIYDGPKHNLQYVWPLVWKIRDRIAWRQSQIGC